MEYLQDVLTLEYLFLVIASIISVVVAKTGIEFAADVKALFELLAKYVSPESDGGKSLTDTELHDLKSEVFDLIYKIWKKYKGSILGKVGKMIGSLRFW